MQKKSLKFLKALGTAYILVTVVIGSFPLSALADTQITVDVKVNGSDGPVALNSGDTFTYTWVSSGATTCQQTSPINSGVPTSGQAGPIVPGHPFYPTDSDSAVITIECTDGTNTASDSVTVSLATPTPPADQTPPDNSTTTPPTDSTTTPPTDSTSTPPSNPDPVIIPTPAGTTPSVDIKANGSDGPLTLDQGESFNLSWSSSYTTSCQLTSPVNSGVGIGGEMGPIDPSHPYYPAAGNSVTFTVECTDGTNTASDSVTVSAPSAPTPPPTSTTTPPTNGTTTPPTGGGGGGSTPIPTTPSVDVKANNSDGPLTLDQGESFNVTWVSSNSTSCQLTSPVNSGVQINGSMGPIDSSHPYYPAAGHSVTFTVECTDGTNTASDSVVVSAQVPLPPPTFPAVDVKVNGSDGPVTLTQGQSFTYTWVSSYSTSCQLTSPTNSGIATQGASAEITPSHPFYPTVSNPTIITVECTDGTHTASDSVSVIAPNIPPPPPPSNPPPPPVQTVPTVDVKANGSDGPVTLDLNQTFNVTWVSSNSTSCQLTSPVNSGVQINGSMGPIDSSHPYYPAAGHSVTFTVECTDGTNTASDSVVVSAQVPLPPPPPVTPTVDVKANGSDGPVTLTHGDTYTYTWTSTNATSCKLESPVTQNLSTTNGQSAVIGVGNSFYPADNGSVTIKVKCFNGNNFASDSVIVKVVPMTITPPPPPPTLPTVDVKANGSDGPVTLDLDQGFTVTWSSSYATSCQLTSPVNSGVPITGSMGPINPGHPYYPADGQFVIFTVECTDGTHTASDSVKVIAQTHPTPPPPPVQTVPTVDVKANGSDGPVTLTHGDTYHYTWVSTNATSCQETSPFNSGITINGQSSEIGPGTAQLYPSDNGHVIITIECTDGTHTASDSVQVNVVPVPPPPSPPPPAQTGSITVCKVALDSDGHVINASSTQASFSTVLSGPSSFNQTATFQTPLTLNTKILSSDAHNDAQCETFHNLNLGEYDYTQELGADTNVWQTPKYNDQFTGGITNFITDSFHFAADGSHEDNDDNDGVIILDASRPDRMLVIVNQLQAPVAPPTLPTVDVKANGSDGPVTLTHGDTYVYTWTSSNATSCEQTSPTNSGIAINGQSPTIGVGDPLYPSDNGHVIITIECTDGVNTASDSVQVNVVPASTGGGPSCDMPDITNALTASTTVGDVFNFSLTSSTSTTFSLDDTMLPPGLSFSTSTNSITGTTTTAGIFSVPISATNTCGTTSDTLVITVNNPSGGGSCPLPTISPLTATVTVGDNFDFTFDNASSSTFDLATSSLPDGLTFSTSTATISGIPTTSGVFDIKVTATNNCGTTTDTLVITVNNPPNSGGGGGGGGGGSSSGGGGGFSSGGGHPACLYLHDYMRIDFTNDPSQVYLLQSFLKYIEGYNVSLTGVFDQATFQAVSAFQNKYKDDILTPWGLTQPTGYVYILTLKKINEIYCQTIYPLTEAQNQEILAYKALIESLRAQGINPELPGGFGGGQTIEGQVGGTSTSTITIPVVGVLSPPKGQNSNLAAAILALPTSVGQFFQCLWELLLILLVLYITASVLEDVLYSDLPENMKKRYFTKWGAFGTLVLVAIIVAYYTHDWCIILPLLIVLILTLVALALYPKRNSIKAWKLVVAARGKTLMKPKAQIFTPVIVTKETKTEVKTEEAKPEVKVDETTK